MRRFARRGAIALIFAFPVLLHGETEPLSLALPTDNDAIFEVTALSFINTSNAITKG